jgi:hypothetical protein
VISKNDYISLMNKIAERLIALNSKTWLCEKLGITRPTLDRRLKENDWKTSEKVVLNQLDKMIYV